MLEQPSRDSNLRPPIEDSKLEPLHCPLEEFILRFVWHIMFHIIHCMHWGGILYNIYYLYSIDMWNL